MKATVRNVTALSRNPLIGKFGTYSPRCILTGPRIFLSPAQLASCSVLARAPPINYADARLSARAFSRGRILALRLMDGGTA